MSVYYINILYTRTVMMATDVPQILYVGLHELVTFNYYTARRRSGLSRDCKQSIPAYEIIRDSNFNL